MYLNGTQKGSALIVQALWLDSLLKNPSFDLALKGRGFSRSESATKSTTALAVEAVLSLETSQTVELQTNNSD